jgi:hypothetical protein
VRQLCPRASPALSPPCQRCSLPSPSPPLSPPHSSASVGGSTSSTRSDSATFGLRWTWGRWKMRWRTLWPARGTSPPAGAAMQAGGPVHCSGDGWRGWLGSPLYICVTSPCPARSPQLLRSLRALLFKKWPPVLRTHRSLLQGSGGALFTAITRGASHGIPCSSSALPTTRADITAGRHQRRSRSAPAPPSSPAAPVARHGAQRHH